MQMTQNLNKYAVFHYMLKFTASQSGSVQSMLLHTNSISASVIYSSFTILSK